MIFSNPVQIFEAAVIKCIQSVIYVSYIFLSVTCDSEPIRLYHEVAREVFCQRLNFTRRLCIAQANFFKV